MYKKARFSGNGSLFAIMLAILMIGVHANGQEKNMNENLPQNTLAVFTDNGKTVYLTEIYRVPVEAGDWLPDSWYGKWYGKADGADGNYGDFLHFTLVEGRYPENYTKSDYYFHSHLIPGKIIFKLMLWRDYSDDYKKGKLTSTKNSSTTGQWENAGYSTDDSLWAKIFEYYQSKR